MGGELFPIAIKVIEGIVPFTPLVSRLPLCDNEHCHIHMTRFSLFCHRCEDGLLDMDRELRIELSWGNGLFCHMFKHHAHHIGSGKGSPSGKEFVSNAAQSVLIAFLTGGAAKLLWCHVWRGAGNGALPDTDGGKHLRNTEIG